MTYKEALENVLINAMIMFEVHAGRKGRRSHQI